MTCYRPADSVRFVDYEYLGAEAIYIFWMTTHYLIAPIRIFIYLFLQLGSHETETDMGI
jgi:hypothetical protein